MCGRYALHAHPSDVARFFALREEVAFTPRYNIAPTQAVPILLAQGRGRLLRPMSWGLLPLWTKDRSFASKTFNARSETAHEKPAFKESFLRGRCLVPATGYYEWDQRRKKAVSFVRIRNEDGELAELFAFAGLWSPWRDAEGREVPTFTVLTAEANEVLSPMHPRMPVILRPESYDRWLHETRSPEEARQLLQPLPAEAIAMHRVGPAVGSVANDGPECLEPIEDPPEPEQTSLF